MSLDALKKKLKEDIINGIFLLCGSDEYTKDYYASEIRRKACTTLPEFNNIVFDGEKGTPAELIAAIDGYPYMSETKLVEIKNLFPDDLNEKTAEEYSTALVEVPDFCTVLIKYSSEEFDPKKVSSRGKKKGAANFIESIKKNGIIVDFETPTTDRLITWAAKHFTSAGVKVNQTELRYLIDYCGSDMYTLYSEINKLCMYCKGRTVTKDDINHVCCPNTVYRVFDMTKAMTEGDYTRAFKIFDSLKFYKTEPVMILGTLAKLISDLSIIKSGADAGMSSIRIAQGSGISEWQVKKNLDFLRKNDGGFLPLAAKYCLDADIKLKSSSEDPYTVLENLVARISSYGR